MQSFHIWCHFGSISRQKRCDRTSILIAGFLVEGSTQFDWALWDQNILCLGLEKSRSVEQPYQSASLYRWRDMTDLQGRAGENDLTAPLTGFAILHTDEIRHLH